MLPQGLDAPMPLGVDAGSKATEQSHVEPQIAGIRGRHDAEMWSSAKEKKTKENQHSEKQRMIQWMVSGHGWLVTASF